MDVHYALKYLDGNSMTTVDVIYELDEVGKAIAVWPVHRYWLRRFMYGQRDSVDVGLNWTSCFFVLYK